VRAAAVLFLLVSAARAQPVAADLVADRESVAPGGKVRVGVRFRLEPHWHVYWKNPGDSGQPPSVRWTLPQGVVASDIAWPAPRRIPTPPFMTFGYEGEVVLSCELTVPAEYSAPTLPVVADVEWLVCDPNGCVPGEAKLSTEIPVRPGDAPGTPIASGLPVAAGEVAARYDGERVRLRVAAPGAPSFFFPAEPGTIEPSAPQEAVEGGLLLTPAKSRGEPLRVLRGVLAFASGPAWEVEVAVEPGAPPGNRPKWLWGVAIAVALLFAHRIFSHRKEKTA
jgi:thiol:disulfide interchange protein DsbD